jgi:hypothetical protein
MTTSRQERASDRAKSGKDLDEALEETFPASDPIATSPKRGGKNDKRVDTAVAPSAPESETTDAKTPSNMSKFHKVFERRRR